MTVQEIFNTKAVQEIETEILNLQYQTENDTNRLSVAEVEQTWIMVCVFGATCYRTNTVCL